MTVGVLLLAAGSSRRFGSDKRIATLASGETLLNTSIKQILDTGLSLKVCLRGDDYQLADTLAEQGVTSILCTESHGGMGATLSQAIGYVSDWNGALIALADMPFISPQTYLNVAHALTKQNICLPTNSRGPGHPVGFGQSWFNALQHLKGDKGGLSIIKDNKIAITQVPCSDINLQRDIDTPESIDGN